MSKKSPEKLAQMYESSASDSSEAAAANLGWAAVCGIITWASIESSDYFFVGVGAGAGMYNIGRSIGRFVAARHDRQAANAYHQVIIEQMAQSAITESGAESQPQG